MLTRLRPERRSEARADFRIANFAIDASPAIDLRTPSKYVGNFTLYFKRRQWNIKSPKYLQIEITLSGLGRHLQKSFLELPKCKEEIDEIALFRFWGYPDKLSGKQAGYLRMPTSPIVAAMVITRVPLGKIRLTSRPLLFRVCLW